MKSTELFRALVLALTVSSSTALVTANQVPLSFLALRGRSTTTTKPYVPITPDAFPTATRTSSSCLHAAAKRAASKMTLAGKILPALQKFLIGPAKFKAIVTNVVSMTHWVDLLVLAAVAWGVRPLAQFTYERGLGRRDDNHDQQQQPASFEASRRYWTAQTAAQVALVALSVYAVDVMSVVLSTVGFRFVDQTDYPANYAKVAYTTLAVQKLLRLKTATLCRLFKVSPDNMGRLDVLDRLVNGLIVSLVSLVLLDWLSVQMGMAMRGLFAFGSVGTLAFTLASQGLLTQLMSGGFLIFSNKMNVGDYVTFGDNVAGTVTKLGWFDTTLRGADNTVTRIPNAGLASQNISNLSRVRQCQVAQTLRFHYEDVDVLPAVLDSIKEEIKRSCPRLITDGTRYVWRHSIPRVAMRVYS